MLIDFRWLHQVGDGICLASAVLQFRTRESPDAEWSEWQNVRNEIRP